MKRTADNGVDNKTVKNPKPSLKGLLRLGGAALLSGAWAAAPPHGAEADLRRDATVEAVEQAMPSVVNIATETIVEYNDPFEQMLRDFWRPYYRRRSPNTQYSLGSGVIIDENGYVLTNLHVVRRASKVWVKLADGREFEARMTICCWARRSWPWAIRSGWAARSAAAS